MTPIDFFLWRIADNDTDFPDDTWKFFRRTLLKKGATRLHCIVGQNKAFTTLLVNAVAEASQPSLFPRRNIPKFIQISNGSP
jgi:hypothetical protein